MIFANQATSDNKYKTGEMSKSGQDCLCILLPLDMKGQLQRNT